MPNPEQKQTMMVEDQLVCFLQYHYQCQYQWCCGWKRKPTGALASSSRLVLQPTLAENDLTAYISSFPTPEGSTTFSLKQVTQVPDNASRALAFSLPSISCTDCPRKNTPSCDWFPPIMISHSIGKSSAALKPVMVLMVPQQEFSQNATFWQRIVNIQWSMMFEN